jgi:hypothetical protein
LIEIGKKGTKTLTVNSFQNQSAFVKKSIYFAESKYSNYYINKLD